MFWYLHVYAFTLCFLSFRATIVVKKMQSWVSFKALQTAFKAVVKHVNQWLPGR